MKKILYTIGDSWTYGSDLQFPDTESYPYLLSQKLDCDSLVNEAIKGVKIRQCAEMYLEVRCSNNDAVRLYEKLGISLRQRLKAYYRDGEDASLMAIDFAS